MGGQWGGSWKAHRDIIQDLKRVVKAYTCYEHALETDLKDLEMNKWLFKRLLGPRIDVFKLFKCLTGRDTLRKVTDSEIRSKFWIFFLQNVYPDREDIKDVLKDVVKDKFMIPAKNNTRHLCLNDEFFLHHKLDREKFRNVLKQCVWLPERVFLEWVQKHGYKEAIKAPSELPPSVHPVKEEIGDDVKEEIDDDDDATDHDDATGDDDGSMDDDGDEEVEPQPDAHTRISTLWTPPRPPTRSPPTRSPPRRKRPRTTRPPQDFRSADDRHGRDLSSGGADGITRCIATTGKCHQCDFCDFCGIVQDD